MKTDLINHLQGYWWAYWAAFASALLLFVRFKRTDRSKSPVARVRSLLSGHRYGDPTSPAYDPGLFGRQLRLLALGLPLIALALVIVWLLGG